MIELFVVKFSESVCCPCVLVVTSLANHIELVIILTRVCVMLKNQQSLKI